MKYVYIYIYIYIYTAFVAFVQNSDISKIAIYPYVYMCGGLAKPVGSR